MTCLHTIDGCDMNVRAQIVCWMVVLTALFGGVACRDDGNSTPTPTVTAVVETAETEVESEPTVTPDSSDSLPAVVAQVATTAPTPGSTQTVAPTSTPIPTEVDTAVDEPTPTERGYIVRTEVPTATPVVATSTPVVENVLLLPTPRTYTVREGDTIKSIAYFCEVTVVDLLAENDIAVDDADRIVPGQVLLVPEAN